ncbi:MAG: hypothetical protein HC817_13455, partial [Saprospiraceae bacterium]|nr:hypothetical protein [Saprospiraceae bacterium]
AHEGAWTEGDWVEVVYGPLLGLKGRLVNLQGKDKLLIELHSSGHTLEIGIETKYVQKIS